MADDQFTNIRPIGGGESEFTNIRPVADLSAQNAVIDRMQQEAQQPTFAERYFPQFGLPTSREEVEAMRPKTVTEVLKNAFLISQPAIELGKQLYGYGKRQVQAQTEVLREGKEAYQNVKAGQPVLEQAAKPISAMGKAYFGMAPFIGEPIVKMGEDLYHGQGGAALGGALGALGQAALAYAGTKGKPTPEAGLTRIGKGTGIPYTPEAVSASVHAGMLEPSAKEAINAARDLDIAKADLAEIARKPVKVKGAGGTYTRLLNVMNYADNLWEKAHNEPIARRANMPFDTKGVLEDVAPVLSDVAAQNAPAEAKAAGTWLQGNFTGPPKTIGEVDALLREVRADLKSPSAQTAYAPLMYRVKSAVADSLVKRLDEHLEALGETGVRDSNRRYGALRTVARNMADSAVSEARQSGGKNWFQRAMHIYTYLNPLSGTPPHMGISALPGRSFTPPSTHIAAGFKILANSELKAPAIVPPTTPAMATPPTAVAPPWKPPTEPIKLNDWTMKRAEGQPAATPSMERTTPEQTAPAPRPSAFETQAIEAQRVNKGIQLLTHKMPIDSKIRPATRQWIEQKYGVNLDNPEEAAKALQMLRKRQTELTPPKPAKTGAK